MDAKTETKAQAQKKNQQPKAEAVIAFRKKCAAEGTGLSHYILVNEKAKP